jgi:hypothetical protein
VLSPSCGRGGGGGGVVVAPLLLLLGAVGVLLLGRGTTAAHLPELVVLLEAVTMDGTLGFVLKISCALALTLLPPDSTLVDVYVPELGVTG